MVADARMMFQSPNDASHHSLSQSILWAYSDGPKFKVVSQN